MLLKMANDVTLTDGIAAAAAAVGTALGGPVVGKVAAHVVELGAKLFSTARKRRLDAKEKALLEKAIASTTHAQTALPTPILTPEQKAFALFAKQSKIRMKEIGISALADGLKTTDNAPQTTQTNGGTPDATKPAPDDLTPFQKFMKVFENPVTIFILLGAFLVLIVMVARSMFVTKEKMVQGRTTYYSKTKGKGKAGANAAKK